MVVGHNSDRTGERRLHTAVPIALGGLALVLTPFSLGVLPLTMCLLIVARTGIKAYQPAFWDVAQHLPHVHGGGRRRPASSTRSATWAASLVPTSWA